LLLFFALVNEIASGCKKPINFFGFYALESTSFENHPQA